MQVTRIKNLDLLRALAIVLVIYFHVTQMIFGGVIEDKATFNLGKYGVNVFFVLSGFLIGGMYYRADHVVPVTFWLKRFLRTYPPYLIALFLSWTAVYFTRGEEFDPGFLFMAQNFYKEIPYFLVSWSLCIEEHFYLVFALLIFVIKNKKHHLWIWLLVCLAPIPMRYLFSDPSVTGFGYNQTATLFQIDSISYGVLASYGVFHKKVIFNAKRQHAMGLFAFFLAATYILTRFPSNLSWIIGPTVLNFCIVALLLVLYHMDEAFLSKLRFTRINATMAYSIYLVHPLCIHACIQAGRKFGISSTPYLYIITLAAIYITAYLFYISVEKPVIVYRDKILKNGLPFRRNSDI